MELLSFSGPKNVADKVFRLLLKHTIHPLVRHARAVTYHATPCQTSLRQDLRTEEKLEEAEKMKMEGNRWFKVSVPSAKETVAHTYHLICQLVLTMLLLLLLLMILMKVR